MVNGRNFEDLFIMVINNKMLNGTLKDDVRKVKYLIFWLKVKNRVRTGSKRLLIFFEDDILKILDIGLINKYDFAIFEMLEFLR